MTKFSERMGFAFKDFITFFFIFLGKKLLNNFLEDRKISFTALGVISILIPSILQTKENSQSFLYKKSSLTFSASTSFRSSMVSLEIKFHYISNWNITFLTFEIKDSIAASPASIFSESIRLSS